MTTNTQTNTNECVYTIGAVKIINLKHFVIPNGQQTYTHIFRFGKRVDKTTLHRHFFCGNHRNGNFMGFFSLSPTIYFLLSPPMRHDVFMRKILFFSIGASMRKNKYVMIHRHTLYAYRQPVSRSNGVDGEQKNN